MKLIILAVTSVVSLAPLPDCLGQSGAVLPSEKSVRRIDSLKKSLVDADSKQKFEALSAIAFAFQNEDSAIHYADLSINLAYEVRDSNRVVEAINVKGLILRDQGRVEVAAGLFEKDLRLAQRLRYGLMERFLLNNLATTYTLMAQYDKALDCHLLSLSLREKLKDFVAIHVTLNNIGVIYEEMEDFEQALNYYEQALKAISETGLQWELEAQMSNIGGVLIKLGRIEDAEVIAKEISRRCESRSCQSTDSEPINSLFGLVCYYKSDYRTAEIHFGRALYGSQHSSLGGHALKERVALNSYWLARTFFESGNISKSLRYLDEGQQIAQRSGYERIVRDNLLLYSRLYSAMGDLKRALDFQRMHDELASKILNGKLLNRITRLQARIEERENTAKLATQGKILELQEASIQRQKVLNALIGIVTLLAVILTVVLFRNNRQSKKINQLLDQRIRERTSELLTNRDQLQHAYDQQVLMISKLSSELNSTVATLRGLTLTAERDSQRDQAIYLKQAEIVAEKLVEYVSRCAKLK